MFLLFFRAKLLELQERHNRIQLALNMAGMGDGLEDVVTKLNDDTEDLELEMECLVQQMQSLTSFVSKETNAWLEQTPVQYNLWFHEYF